MKEFFKTWFTRAMTDADVNSRLIYLGHGVVTGICVLTLVIAFIVAKNKEAYPTMIGAVSGTGILASAGRYLTKLGNKESTAETDTQAEDSAK